MAGSAREKADKFASDFLRLLGAADALTPGTSVGAWTVKDVIAHIAAWDREIGFAIDKVLAGEPVHYAKWDEDDFNRGVSDRARTAFWADVRRAAIATNGDLCSKIRQIGSTDWNRSSGHAWRDGTPMTPASVVAYTYRGQTHYAGHAEELEGAIET